MKIIRFATTIITIMFFNNCHSSQHYTTDVFIPLQNVEHESCVVHHGVFVQFQWNDNPQNGSNCGSLLRRQHKKSTIMTEQLIDYHSQLVKIIVNALIFTVLFQTVIIATSLGRFNHM